VRMDNLVEWMAGETEVLGENLPRRHFVHHKSHLTRPGIESGPPWWEANERQRLTASAMARPHTKQTQKLEKPVLQAEVSPTTVEDLFDKAINRSLIT
jgi:hypothetical protein